MSERDKNAAVKRNSPAREIWRRFKKNKAAMLGLGIFSVMVLLAVFADVICDYDTQVIAQDVANRLKAPSPDHWFGTDAYGRDIFARVVHGARISIIIGLAATVAACASAGYWVPLPDITVAALTMPSCACWIHSWQSPASF